MFMRLSIFQSRYTLRISRKFRDCLIHLVPKTSQFRALCMPCICEFSGRLLVALPACLRNSYNSARKFCSGLSKLLSIRFSLRTVWHPNRTLVVALIEAMVSHLSQRGNCRKLSLL